VSQIERTATRPQHGPQRLIETEPGTCCAGAWANVTITRWQSRATGPAVERVLRVSSEIRAAYPSGISSIHIIREGAAMPTPEGRAGLVKLMNAHADQLACVAIVVGGSGFWASAIRSLVTGMRTVSSRAYQLRLFGSIDGVVAWLPALHTQRTGIAVDPDEFARALAAANAWDAGEAAVAQG
jgi:hypothetical protein